jgi:hypothetical protein
MTVCGCGELVADGLVFDNYIARRRAMMMEGRWNTGCIQGVVGCGARVAGECAVVIWS